MRIRFSAVVLYVGLGALVSCGSPAEKTGSEGERNSFTYTPNNGGGGGGGGGEGMEQGSPEAEVRSAFDTVLPGLCAYDQTCDEPTFGGMCPTYDQYTQIGAGISCWVVDQQQAEICASALQGLQCEGQYQNLPPSCGVALRPCRCLDGYEQEFVNGELGCYQECFDSECSDGLGCYDGVCTPPQEGECTDDQVEEFIDGEFGCYDPCDVEPGEQGECPAGMVCGDMRVCVSE